MAWRCGCSDQALRICTEARRYADTFHHPFSQAMARTISLRVHQLRGETAVVADLANSAIELCEEHEFVHYLTMALILHGWARAQEGQFNEGIAEIQKGLQRIRTTGALLLESYTLGLLADVCLKNGRYGQAFEFLRQAQLSFGEESAKRFYAAEIYRLLGATYLHSRRDLDQAERYLVRGLEIAREQKAKSLELRICLSICDLYALRKEANQYRPLLGEIYRSFSEGLDTADLVEARARLQNA